MEKKIYISILYIYSKSSMYSIYIVYICTQLFFGNKNILNFLTKRFYTKKNKNNNTKAKLIESFSHL